MNLNLSLRIFTSIILLVILFFGLYLDKFIWLGLLILSSIISFYEFFNLIQKKYNRKSIIIRIPSFVFYIMGLLGNVFRFIGIKTELSLANMKILMINNYFKNDKSLKELNLKYSPTEKAINDAVNFFRS